MDAGSEDDAAGGLVAGAALASLAAGPSPKVSVLGRACLGGYGEELTYVASGPLAKHVAWVDEHSWTRGSRRPSQPVNLPQPSVKLVPTREKAAQQPPGVAHQRLVADSSRARSPESNRLFGEVRPVVPPVGRIDVT